jgi:hypothetical protein
MKTYKLHCLNPIVFVISIFCFAFIFTSCPVEITEHKHQWGEWSVVRAATCEVEGYGTRTCACGNIENVIPALGHVWRDYWEVTSYPTCIDAGVETDICTREGTHTRTRPVAINLLGHQWVWTQTNPITSPANNFSATGTCIHDQTHTKTFNGNLRNLLNDLPLNNADTPHTLVLKLNDLGGRYTEIGSFGNALFNINSYPHQNKYVHLDLSGSTFTSIGDSAFSWCRSLTSITIPNSVTSIGDWAFDRCENFTAINVDSSNAEYSSIDGVLYNKDKTTLHIYPMGKTASSFTVPNSVISIGDNAFFDCTSLVSVTLGNNVTSIGESAFSYCTSLASVTLGNSVAIIERGAFYACTSLTSITLGNSVISIGESAFSYCTSLVSVTLGNSVISIGYIFERCDNLVAINVDTGNTTYSSVDGVLYSKDKTSLIKYPTRKTASSFTIPNSVTQIRLSAFVDTSLTSVTFEGTILQYFFHSQAFYWIVDVESGITMEEGDLRAKFYATDPDNGTPGTYTRASGGFVWTKQP